MSAPLYLDTSLPLRAVLEGGVSADVAKHIDTAPLLLTSRLTLVESARAFVRLRASAASSETSLANAERDLDELLSRCEIWELTPRVCEVARAVAPRSALRTLDALHLATFVLARRRIPAIHLLTSDQRLQAAATSV